MSAHPASSRAVFHGIANSRTATLQLSVGATLSVLFIGSVLCIDGLQITQDGYSTTGFSLFAYNAARALLTLCVIFAALGIGDWLAGAPTEASPTEAAWERGITALHMGLGLLALSGIGLGLIGQLHSAGAVVCILAGLWLFPRLLEAARELGAERSWSLSRIASTGSPAQRLCILVCAAILGSLLVSGALYPADNDWEVYLHYLPYFAQVVESGDLGPNEVWYHYFLSKGSGLSLLLAALSDELGISLASFVCVAAASLCVFDIVRRATGSLTFAAVGLCFVAASYHFSWTNGYASFVKHHATSMSLIVYVLWSLIRLHASVRTPRRVLRGALLVALWLSFMMPVLMAVVLPTVALVALLHLRGGGRHLLRFASVAAACTVGMLGSIALNYARTGLGLDAPLGPFWAFADRERIEATLGFSGLFFFLTAPAEWSAAIDPWNAVVPRPGWLLDVLQIGRLDAWWIAVFPLAGGLLALTRHASMSRVRGSTPAERFGVRACAGLREVLTAEARATGMVLGVFFLVALWVANLAFGVTSLRRMYFLTVAPSAAILACACGYVARLWWPTESQRALRGAIAEILCVILLVLAWTSMNRSHRLDAPRFALGLLSLQDTLDRSPAMAQLQRGAHEPDERRALSDAFERFQSIAGSESRIWFLSQPPAPVVFFPRPGLLTEPSFSLGPRFDELVAGDAATAERILRARNIDYFLVDLAGALWGALPSSALFDAAQASQRLREVASFRDFALLTWRESPSARASAPARDTKTFEALELHRGLWLQRVHDPARIAEVARVVSAGSELGAAGEQAARVYTTCEREVFGANAGSSPVYAGLRESFRAICADAADRLRARTQLALDEETARELTHAAIVDATREQLERRFSPAIVGALVSPIAPNDLRQDYLDPDWIRRKLERIYPAPAPEPVRSGAHSATPIQSGSWRAR